MNSRIYQDYFEIHGSYWNKIEKEAIKRGLEFRLSLKEAWDLFIRQNRLCAISLDYLTFSNPKTASLDRIDSSKGYSLHNVQWVHKTLNIMKWHFPYDYFLNICNLVANKGDLPLLELPVIDYTFKHPHWTGIGSLTGTQWGQIKSKRHRKSKTIEFDLAIKDAWDLYVFQNGRCALTGIPIYFGAPPLFTASLDRIDASRGYFINNIQWVHKDVNRIKLCFDNNEFMNICKKIALANPRCCYEMLLPGENWINSFNISEFSKAYEKTIKKRRNNKRSNESGYKGVHRSRNRWRASLSYNGNKLFEQDFVTANEAARHYDYYALEYLGRENTYLNFPDYDYSNFVPRSKGTIDRKGVSGYYGVAHNSDKHGKKWRVTIGHKSKRYAIGKFDNAIEAAHNYDYYIIKIRGLDNCLLNFPDYDYSNFTPFKIIKF